MTQPNLILSSIAEYMENMLKDCEKAGMTMGTTERNARAMQALLHLQFQFAAASRGDMGTAISDGLIMPLSRIYEAGDNPSLVTMHVSHNAGLAFPWLVQIHVAGRKLTVNQFASREPAIEMARTLTWKMDIDPFVEIDVIE